MNMPYTGVTILINIYQFFEKFIHANALGSHSRNDGNAKHLAQCIVFELHATLFQLIIHIQGNNHLYIHINKLRSQEQIPFQIRGIDNIDNNIGHFFHYMRSHIQFLRRVFGNGIRTRQIHNFERITILLQHGFFRIHRYTAIIPNPLVRS